MTKVILPGLRVTAEKAPCRVVRRSFGITKPLSSRLAWRFFNCNRTALVIENAPTKQAILTDALH